MIPARRISIDKEYIICAALYYDNESTHLHQPKNIKTGFVICGLRHHNCSVIMMMLLKDTLSPVKRTIIQGFLTSEDRFVDRKKAGEIAFKTGQINKETDCLFSEDLY